MSDVSSATAHRHPWRVRARVDGCHFIEVRSYCPTCGAQRAEFEDRDFENDPTSIVFAERDCPRCRELATAAGYEGDWSWRLK